MRNYSILIVLMLTALIVAKETSDKGFLPFDLPDVKHKEAAATGTNSSGKCCKESSTLEVTGVGQVQVRADVINIGVEISTVNASSASQALQDNNNKVQIFINTLTAGTEKGGLGLDLNQISTVSFSISPVYTTNDQGETTFIGFKVSQVLEVVVNQLILAGRVIDATTTVEGASVLYVNFNVSDEIVKENRSDLIREAVDDATVKAKKVAKANNQRITGIKDIKVLDQAGVVAIKEGVTADTSLIGSSRTVAIAIQITYTITKKINFKH